MNKETNNNQKQIPQGFKLTDIGLIPEDWEVCSFKGNILYETGKRMKGGGLKIGEVMSIGGEHIDENGNLIYERMKYISREFYQKLQQGKVKEHDVILVKDGATTGKLAFIWKLNHELAINEHAFILRSLNEKRLINQFIYYGLLSESGQLQIKKHYHGLIGGINRGDLDKFKIPLPPLPEQKKIAYVLSKIQQAIETQEKIIKTTQELKKALMQKLFTEGLNGEPQKQTEIGLIPESWEVKTIEEVYTFTKKPRGKNISGNTILPFIPMEYISDSDIEANLFILKKFSEIPSGTYFENGDLLLAKITPSFENGKQGIATINFPFGYATTEVIPIQSIKNLSDVKYLFYYLLKEDVRKLLTGKMEGSTGRQRLPKNVVQSTLIPFPKLDIQKDISSIFLSLDDKIKQTSKRIIFLRELFTNLLNQLMAGQIRVKDIEFKLEETAKAVR